MRSALWNRLVAGQAGVYPPKIDSAILATRDGEIIASRLRDGQMRVSGEGKAPPGSSPAASSGGPTRTGVILAGAGVVLLLGAPTVLVYALTSRARPGV